MRSWCSDQIAEDAPTLPAALRAEIFKTLEPHREQLQEEHKNKQAESERKLRDLQKLHEATSAELQLLRDQLGEARMVVTA